MKKDADHQYVQHIMFGNAEDGHYINPYAYLVNGYKDYSRTLMQASVWKEKTKIGFLLLKVCLLGLCLTFLVFHPLSVTHGYTPFYYKTTLRNPNTGHMVLI